MSGLPPAGAHAAARASLLARLLQTAPSARLSAFGAALAALVLILAAAGIWHAHEAALADAEQELLNLNHALAGHTASAVRSADLVLRGTAEWIRGLSPEERADTEALHHLLVARAAGMPQIKRLGVYRADGSLWLNSGFHPVPALNNYDDPYFAAHLAGADIGLYIAVPRKSKLERKWYLFFSRAIRGRDGRFAGVVVALIDPDYFEAFYGRIELGQGGAVGLVRTDGYVMMRHPDNETWLGRQITNGPLYRLIAGAGDGVVRAVSPLDGVARLFSVKQLQDFPLAVTVGVSEETALQQWRGASYRLATAAVFGAAAILLLVGGLTRHMRTREVLGSELRRSEALLAEAQQIARVGHWEWDIAGDRFTLSDALCRIIGAQAPCGGEAAQGGTCLDTFTKLVHPQDRQRVSQEIDAALHGAGGCAIDHRIVQPGGAVRTVHLQVKVAHGGDGAPSRVVGTVQDITGRKQAEEALRESELRYRELVESVNAVIIGLDLNGRITFFNDFAERFFGFRRDEVIGRHVTESFVPPRATDGSDLRGMVADILATPENYQVNENENICKDGRRVWLRWANHAIHDDRGEPVGLLAVGTDITDRKRAEEALRSSEEKLRSMFEFSPLGIILNAMDGRFVEANPAMLRMVGYTLDEFCALSYWDLTPKKFEPDEARQLESLARTGRYGPYEKEYIRKDGSLVPINLNGVLVTGSDGQHYIWSTVEDITERKRAEDALRRLNLELEEHVVQRTEELAASNAQLREALATLKRAQQELVQREKLAGLGALVAGVAHELNTPLGNSLTVATTLAEKTLEFAGEVEGGTVRRSTLQAYVEQATQASSLLTRGLMQASELINDFKQVAVDQTSAQRRAFDLAEVIGEVAAMLHPQFRRSSHRLELALSAGIPMDSFPGPLGQVISNLVTNALVHAFDGRSGGTVSIEALRPGDGWVRLRVQDDGNGIPPEHMPRIFDPFFTTKLGRGGSGLGLHIVYSIVTRVLGGRIEAASEPGAGTRFVIDLPLTAPVQQQGSQPLDAVAVG